MHKNQVHIYIFKMIFQNLNTNYTASSKENSWPGFIKGPSHNNELKKNILSFSSN